MENSFPPLLNDRLLKAARGEEVDRAPVWIMRQGRGSAEKLGKLYLHFTERRG